MFIRSALLAAAASLIAAAAVADPVPAPVTSIPQTPPEMNQAGPPDTSTNGSATMGSDATTNGSASMGVTTPDASADTGAAADTSATVDANGVLMHSAAPIPDTPANRAAYGQPLSRTGKLTPPIGN
jgi:opacity protein-like surface antigen